MTSLYEKRLHRKIYTSEDLHLCTFKTPTSWAVMSEQGDADCAASQQMRNGVKWSAPVERHFKSLLESDS